MPLRNDSCQTEGSTLYPFNIMRVQNFHHLFQNHSITVFLLSNNHFKIQTIKENPLALHFSTSFFKNQCTCYTQLCWWPTQTSYSHQVIKSVNYDYIPSTLICWSFYDLTELKLKLNWKQYWMGFLWIKHRPLMWFHIELKDEFSVFTYFHGKQ